MIGAIAGDIAGSRFEFANRKSKDFTLFAPGCRPTDDTCMTLAIGRALLETQDPAALPAAAVHQMQTYGRRYPQAGYGARFLSWIFSDDPQPYQSFGNGAAMRISAVGDLAPDAQTAAAWANAVTAVTHNHPAALRAAEAVAVSMVWLRQGCTLAQLRGRVCDRWHYALDFTLDEIRPAYHFDVSCQGSVPQAFTALLESTGVEDALRCAISIGGDSDTIAAITGAMAACHYGVPEEIRARALAYLPPEEQALIAKIDGPTAAQK